MIKPKCPEVGTWKVNELEMQGRSAKQKPTFDQLLNKCTFGIVVTMCTHLKQGITRYTEKA
jgi:hypothetical protein